MPTVLLIQSDPADARVIQEALIGSSTAPFSLEWIRSCAEGVERLSRAQRHGADGLAGVLIDLSLPDSHGIETFNRLFRAARHIPILVLCDTHDEAAAQLAVQQGAQDYLLKPRLDSYWLPKTVASMLDRVANAEALFEEQDRATVTLSSIGDAVMSIDVWGDVTYLNIVAERLTGWPRAQATGRPLSEVFRLIDATSRESVVNPMAQAIRDNTTVRLVPNCLLVRPDGVETPVDDSAAPIHDRRGGVTGGVMVFQDVSAARALGLRMSYLAQHDDLTGLPNRVMLNDRLNQSIAMAHRHGRKLALLFLDVDRFKHINDSLGHGVGDRLLQSVAQRLLGSVRSSDTVSRQGGDEFVLLLPEVTRTQDTAVIAEKILIALGVPLWIDQHEIHVTASMGIVTYPDDGTDAQMLLNNADSAMYHAKEAGRGTYRFFRPDMNAHAIERQFIEEGLRLAGARQEFVLHYQAKVNLTTGVIIAVEALIRWRHPERGLVFPAQFIPIAEEGGSIVPIGRWVLREACRQARSWQLAGLAPIRIAVNVSVVELRARDFAAAVGAILAETGLEPRYLELELTETFLMQDSKSTLAVLVALKAMGVQLALDDFGTGYSSLSRLKRFPIDTLKIDQSFVRDVTTDADATSIVTAVINMGKSLHLRVVAEGIETRDQLTMLREHGCPEGQGYYFGRPVDAATFTPVLERSQVPMSVQATGSPRLQS